MSEGISAGTPARAYTAPFLYQYPQASPCSALLLYHRPNPYEVQLLTTHRAAKVGLGRSLSAGGFYEVKDMFNEAGKVQEGSAELYREAYEELGEEFKEIIPYEAFRDRVEYLWDGMHRVGETMNVHSVIFKMLEVSEAELDAIMALEPTEEQIGKTLETFSIEAHQGDTEAVVRERLKDFHYENEVTAAVRFVAKMEQKAAKEWELAPVRF